MTISGTNFAVAFGAVFEATGTTVLRAAVQALRVNAFAERWVLTARTGCTGRMVFAGERYLRMVLQEHAARCDSGRPAACLTFRHPATTGT